MILWFYNKLITEFLSIFFHPVLIHVNYEPDIAALRADGSFVTDFRVTKVKTAIFEVFHGPSV